jgi:hypothetical protein
MAMSKSDNGPRPTAREYWTQRVYWPGFGRGWTQHAEVGVESNVPTGAPPRRSRDHSGNGRVSPGSVWHAALLQRCPSRAGGDPGRAT